MSRTSRSASSNDDILPSCGNVTSVGLCFWFPDDSLTILASLRQRDKLLQYNTITDAVELIQKSQRILILTGAGISVFNRLSFTLFSLRSFVKGVSCGIPDFRSRDGLYASLKNRGDYDLDDPQQMLGFYSIPETQSYCQLILGLIYNILERIHLVISIFV